MDKEKILTDFDTLSKAKKQGVTSLKLISLLQWSF